MINLLSNIMDFVFGIVEVVFEVAFGALEFVFGLLGGLFSLFFSLGWFLLILGVIIGLVKHHRTSRRKSRHIYDVDDEDFVSYYAQEQK